jgi:hypothetical protein
MDYLLFDQFQGAQHFDHTPDLGKTAARSEWQVTIEYIAESAYAVSG